MAKTIADWHLATRTARYSLKPRPKPYYLFIGRELNLGYKKPLSGAGKWVVRRSMSNHVYSVETIGITDDYADSDGVTILSFKEAQERIWVLTAGISFAGHQQNSVLVRDAIAAYLEHLRANRKSARDAHYRANAFILPNLGDMQVDALTTERIQKWVEELASAPARLPANAGQKQPDRKPPLDADARRRRKATADRALAVLRAALNRARRNGVVRMQSTWHGLQPLETVSPGRIRCLTADEARDLVTSCEGDLKSLVLAGLHTGARLTELMQLNVGDFNPIAGTVVIRPAKSGKPRHLVLSEAGVVFFSRICADRAGTEWMFERKSKKWQKSHKSGNLAEACARAGISPIKFHELRHTYASLSAMAGVPFAVIARNLGHADTRMVKLYYGQLVPTAGQADDPASGPGPQYPLL
jgi:integrase